MSRAPDIDGKAFNCFDFDCFKTRVASILMPDAADYRFITRWEIPAAINRVWHELMTPDDWPTWWRGVERVELIKPGVGPGLGALRRYTWKSRLPYRLSFLMETTRIEDRKLIEGHATGELAGRGVWSLDHTGGLTRVEYLWEVTATKPWIR